MKKNKVVGTKKIDKKTKLKTIRKILPVIISFSVGFGAFGYLYNYNKNRPINDFDINGYNDVNLRNALFIDDTDFVILNAGDHNDTNTNLFAQKMKFLNKKNISTGLIIDSNSTKLCDIYEDASYVKCIISKYDVNYPIFFNIDNVFSNENLRIFEKIELISAFLEKTSVNGIYVGLYGSEENLSRVAQSMSNGNRYSDTFKDYDCLLSTKNDDIEFNGSYSVIKDKKNKLHAKEDLSKIIVGHNLNNVDNFVADESILFNEGDNILDIAEKYNLSVSDLKNYNNIKGKIKFGTKLSIPNRIKKYSYDVKKTDNNMDLIYKGIDISFYQESIDWDKISNNVDFIINRIADFCNKDENTGAYKIDKNFDNNIYKCQQYGIDFGVYGLTRAMTKQAAINEANFIVEKLKNMNVKYPVYFDLEQEHFEKLQATYKDNEMEIKNIIDAFCETIRKSGYIPGIYTSSNAYKELLKITNNDINKYELWIANSKNYKEELDYKHIDDFEKMILKNDNVSIIQLSDHGIIDGIKGYTDLNCCYKDYSRELVNDNSDEIIDYYKFPLTIKTIKYGTSCLLTFGSILYLKRKKTKIKKLTK